MTDALVVPRAAGAAREVAAARAAGVLADGDAAVTVLHMEGGRPAEAPFAVDSILHHRPDRPYTRVVLSRAMTLRDSAWSRALLCRLAQLAWPEGDVAVPRPSRPLRHWWARRLTSAAVAATLGATGGRRRGGYALYRPGRLVAAPSVLGWYVDHAADLVRMDADFRTGARGLPWSPDDPGCRSFLTQCDLPHGFPVGPIAEAAADAATRDAAIATARATQAYLVAGLATKAPVIDAVLRRRFGRRPVRLLDIGGGFGALAAELLLNGRATYAKAVVRDYAPLHLALAMKLHADLREPLAGRFFFSPGEAHSYRYTEPYEAVALVGVLLYLRPHLDRILAAAWQALAPGGVLLVHENIKAPSFKADYDKMFEAAELDAVLARFGRVGYHDPDSRLPLPRGLVGDRTVVRAVVKPA